MHWSFWSGWDWGQFLSNFIAKFDTKEGLSIVQVQAHPMLLYCFMLQVWIQQRVLHLGAIIKWLLRFQNSDFFLVCLREYCNVPTPSWKFSGIVLTHWYQLLMGSVWLQWTAVWHLFYSLCTCTLHIHALNTVFFVIYIYNYKSKSRIDLGFSSSSRFWINFSIGGYTRPSGGDACWNRRKNEVIRSLFELIDDFAIGIGVKM